VAIGDEWFDAFPIRPATEAVDALCESWKELTRLPLPGFNPEMKEPVLTRALKAHVELVTGRNRGLLGMWAAESVINVLDPVTAVIREERRNDIVYGWNNETTGLQLVFEFKKMTRSANDRKHYLGPKGLERFVTGIYSRHQPVAAMVGMLTDMAVDVVPPLKGALATASSVARLRLRRSSSNEAFEEPSTLFQQAEFDTVHHRHVSLAPSHGTIRIAHIFLTFGYPITKAKARTRKIHRKIDGTSTTGHKANSAKRTVRAHGKPSSRAL
jgi:hypothetical protein